MLEVIYKMGGFSSPGFNSFDTTHLIFSNNRFNCFNYNSNSSWY